MKFEKMKWDIQRLTWEGGKDLAIDDTEVTYSLPLPGGTGYFLGIEGRVVTAFSGITGPVKVKIGFENMTEAILQEVNMDTAKDLFGSGITASHFWCSRRGSLYEIGLNPIITFTSDSGDLEDLTEGQLEIVIIYLVPDV